ncbi:MAG TPA: phosphopantothenoylcysteine decarboxylase, partial [Propionibacteriaceae bacterium]|nr:phosphopantothenoylcysteine decarboxylase [Propionibacteriaceae bacterium]
HTEMWQHPATVHNIETLRGRGVHVVGPAEGELTGGDSGPGRMSEPEEIAERALSLAGRCDLAGLEVTVSAGGTREPIDPVRFIGNRSSGRQGVALARAAADRGARVTLVAAHVDAGVLAEAAHPAITTVSVGTAAELQAAVSRAASGADAVVMAAAVADYRPATLSERKLTKESADGPTRTLELVQTDDVLAALVAGRRPGQVVVGFAAETVDGREELLERGRRKLARKGADLLVVNEVGWTVGFEASDNTVVVLGAGGAVVAEASGSKREVADAVWDAVLAVLPEPRR